MSPQLSLRIANLFLGGSPRHNKHLPLNPTIISNPCHPITKHILYLYSMESFIYPDLNKACREKDDGQIKYLGVPRSLSGKITRPFNINNFLNFLICDSQRQICPPSTFIFANREFIIDQFWRLPPYFYFNIFLNCKIKFMFSSISDKRGKGAIINRNEI